MRCLVDLHPAAPSWGLAVDEVLLESAREQGVETVRCWVNEPAVILGRSQAIRSEVHIERTEALQLPVLRRLSGGGCVLHYPGNLNVSVAMEKRAAWKRVSDIFSGFGRWVVDALKSLDLHVRSEDNGFYVFDRKVGGAAQAHRGAYVLYHTTLLVSPFHLPMEDVLLAMRDDYRPQGVASRPRSVISLSEVLGHPMQMETIASALLASLPAQVGRRVEDGALTQHEAERAGRLQREKYEDAAWIRAR